MFASAGHHRRSSLSSSTANPSKGCDSGSGRRTCCAPPSVNPAISAQAEPDAAARLVVPQRKITANEGKPPPRRAPPKALATATIQRTECPVRGRARNTAKFGQIQGQLVVLAYFKPVTTASDSRWSRQVTRARSVRVPQEPYGAPDENDSARTINQASDAAPRA